MNSETDPSFNKSSVDMAALSHTLLRIVARWNEIEYTSEQTNEIKCQTTENALDALANPAYSVTE